MVHTAELTYFPDAELLRDFRSLPGTVAYKQDHIYYNGRLKDDGLKFRLKLIERPDFISPRLICRVNFSKLLHPADKISLLMPSDVQTAEARFNDLTADLLPSLPNFRFWKVNRIDFCVNVHTPYVEEYLRLLKKGDRRHMGDWYDSQGNYSQKPGSLYYVSTARRQKNRGVTVNFYNKADEMLKSFGTDWPTDEQIESLPTDILRLEIQCHKPKVDYMQKKYGFQDKGILNYLDPQIAYSQIATYLQTIAGAGDYHRKSISLELVRRTPCRQGTKEKMERIIRDVARQHSAVWKIRDEYVSSGVMAKDEFNSLVRKLHSYGINPVTISDNRHLAGKSLKEGLPSMVSIFSELALRIQE